MILNKKMSKSDRKIKVQDEILELILDSKLKGDKSCKYYFLKSDKKITKDFAQQLNNRYYRCTCYDDYLYIGFPTTI